MSAKVLIAIAIIIAAVSLIPLPFTKRIRNKVLFGCLGLIVCAFAASEGILFSPNISNTAAYGVLVGGFALKRGLRAVPGTQPVSHAVTGGMIGLLVLNNNIVARALSYLPPQLSFIR